MRVFRAVLTVTAVVAAVVAAPASAGREVCVFQADGGFLCVPVGQCLGVGTCEPGSACAVNVGYCEGECPVNVGHCPPSTPSRA